MNKKSNERGSLLLKTAFAMMAAGLPMQYASASSNHDLWARGEMTQEKFESFATLHERTPYRR